MKAYYDERPSVFEAVGNGSYRYRYGIEEVEAPVTGGSVENEEDGGEDNRQQRKQFVCQEVTVWSPVTSDKITRAVIADRIPSDREQKLVNEYNAVQLGMYGAKTSEAAKARTDAYREFLELRAALKSQVDADCVALGIG